MSRLPRIAIDGRVIQDRYHGIGRHTLELVRAMARQGTADLVVLFGQAIASRLSVRELAEERVYLGPFDARLASLEEQRRWFGLLRDLAPDVLLLPYHPATPWLSPVPSVAVVHDCIVEADPRFAPSAGVRQLYRLGTGLALRRASAVVTISEATRESLARFYGLHVPPENVVQPGVDPRFGIRVREAVRHAAREELALPERYILHVGVRRPHKNQAMLVRAFGLLAAEIDIELVLVGDADERFPDPLPALVEELRLAGRVHLLSGVPERLLPAVYQGASIFAFPSLVEGFGLPVLEAMAAGVPVVASDTAAVAEAAGGAALLVSPLDLSGWTVALRQVLEDKGVAADLRRRGEEVARRRTWEKAGTQMLAVLEAAADEGRTPRAAGKRRKPSPSSEKSVPAIGPSLAMSSKERRVRAAILLVALLALASAFLSRVAFGTAPGERVPRVLNAAWVVDGTVLRGGQPRDIDFFTMREVYGVTGVVNFRTAGRVERQVVEGFRLKYLWLHLPRGGAPREGQLRRLVFFLRAHKATGGAVYIHDQGGVEHVPVVAVMLEMLHGKRTLDAVRDTEQATPSTRPLFTAPQVAAINALARALSLEPYRPPGYRPPSRVHYIYRDADTLRW